MYLTQYVVMIIIVTILLSFRWTLLSYTNVIIIIIENEN